MNAPLRVNLIGAGRVGQTVCHLLQRSGRYRVQDIVARSSASAQAAADFIGAGAARTDITALRPAEIWLLTVPDTQIAATAASLAAAAYAPAIALHCSGFLPASEMAPLSKAGWQLASAHPVYSFADPAVAVRHFAGTPVGIEGDAPAIAVAEALFAATGAQCFALRSEAKAIYHGAAVIANNLTTVLQALAQEAWAEAGLSPEMIRAVHPALLRSTVENVLTLGPQAGLTGPAARGDLRVVHEQQAAIAGWHPAAGEVYRLLSTMAAELKATGQTRQAR